MEHGNVQGMARLAKCETAWKQHLDIGPLLLQLLDPHGAM